jgi:hypothetical protein
MVSPALGQHRPHSGENPPIDAVQIPRATSLARPPEIPNIDRPTPSRQRGVIRRAEIGLDQVHRRTHDTFVLTPRRALETRWRWVS